MISTVYESILGTGRNAYRPLSKAAVQRIFAFDADLGFGPGGTEPNRNRFYTYLTQNGSDVQVRTVAVKARSRKAAPVLKEVALASVDDPWIHVLDLGFQPISGYSVDWRPQGFGMEKHWSYAGRWESEAWALRCMWKIRAPVVNAELLKRTRRFRWSDWPSARGHILDYLKVFNEHPEIELLSKAGLGRFCTRVSIVRKLEKDRAFRSFFMQHADELRESAYTVPVILKAYGKGLSFVEAQLEIDARRQFYCLPREVNSVKALAYCRRRGIRNDRYAVYLQDCKKLGRDLADTKVSFPKQFERRRQAVMDQLLDLRRRKSAEAVEQVNRRIESAMARWNALPGASADGKYCVVVPQTDQEFVAEGKAMANCLSEYAAKVARGDYLVVFVRKARAPEKAYVAASFDLKRGVVSQCYGKNNRRPPKEVREFVDEIFGIKEAMEVAA